MLVAAIGVGLIVIVTALENGRGGSFSRLYERAKEEIRSRIDDQTKDDEILTLATSSTADPLGAESAPGDLLIANTGGRGVSLRTDCTADARAPGALAEGQAVTLQAAGSGRCDGWSLVSAGTESTWVEQQFLEPAGDATLASAASTAETSTTSPPTTTPTTTPTAAPTAAPTASPMPTGEEQAAVWFGSVEASPGQSVAAWIDGVPCDTSTATGAEGAASYFLRVSSSSGCSVTTGTIDGAPASATGSWSAGGSTFLHLSAG